MNSQSDSTNPPLDGDGASASAVEVPLLPPQSHPPAPKCRFPLRVVAILAASMFLAYFDRGTIGTNAVNGHEAREGKEATGFRGTFEMSHTQNGLIPALLILGRVTGTFLIVQAPPSWPAMFVVGAGMLTWTLCALGCGLSFSFYFFACCRFLMGVGQIPLFSYAHVIIDDVAPPGQVSTWMGFYQNAAPVGCACGYLIGSAVGSALNWRWAFFFEALLGLPVFILCFAEDRFLLKKAPRNENEAGTVHSDRSLWQNVKTVFSHVLFDLTLLGTGIFQGYTASIEYWSGRSLEGQFHRDNADAVIGVSLLVSGLAGAFTGGRFLDKVLGTTVRNSMALPGVCWLLLCVVMCTAELAIHNYVLMIGAYFIVMLLMCFPIGGTHVAALWTVPVDLRTLGKALIVVVGQFVGAIPEPIIYGAMLDWMEETKSESNSHRIAMITITAFTTVGSACFLLGAYLTPRYRHYQPGVSQ